MQKLVNEGVIMKYRNHVAQNPLLIKGGVHQKNRSSQRAVSRQKLNSYLDDWYDESNPDDKQKSDDKEEQNSSSFFRSNISGHLTFVLNPE